MCVREIRQEDVRWVYLSKYRDHCLFVNAIRKCGFSKGESFD
jgi:hypothetical protein